MCSSDRPGGSQNIEMGNCGPALNWILNFRKSKTGISLLLLSAKELGNPKTGASPTPPNLPAMTLNSEATDPRDRIFALLGLLGSHEHSTLKMKPRYDPNVRQIFASVVNAFLTSTAELDVLTARPARPRYLSQSEPYKENPLLPSWVPDWTQDTASFLFTSISATQFSSYNALQKFVFDQQSISPSQNDTGDTRYTGFNAELGGDRQSCFKFTGNIER